MFEPLPTPFDFPSAERLVRVLAHWVRRAQASRG